MPINDNNKLGLLIDILNNQASESYISTDEQEQINRLAEQLISNGNLHPNMVEALQQIKNLNTPDHRPFQQTKVNEWLQLFSEQNLS